MAAKQFEQIAPLHYADAASLLFIDRRGRIWAGSDDELLLVETGRITPYRLWREAGGTTSDPDHRWITGAAQLKDGRILIATQKELYEFIEPASAGQRGAWRRLPLKLAPQQIIGTIYPGAGG